MKRELLISGPLGGLVMFVWLMIAHSMLGLNGNAFVRAVPDQLDLHQALKDRISEPGKYAVLYVGSEQKEGAISNYRNEPLYEIEYQGYTHDTVPGFKSLGTFAFLLAPMIAAWLLMMASHEVRSRYVSRALFVVVLGLFATVSTGWPQALMDELSTKTVLLLTLNSLITWLLVGLIVAWQVKPKVRSV